MTKRPDVLTLREPRLQGSDLSYRIDVLEGEPPATGGAASLFIDITGRPITPVSFAGANRRMWRRRALYQVPTHSVEVTMNRQPHHRIRSSQRGPISRASTVGLLCALACIAPLAQGGDNSISGFDQITLAPGDTGTCESSPCTVYLKMPEGEGSYEVMSSGDGRIGEYPAGETVKLGSFWSTQAFEIKGMDVPKAYAYIPNQP